MMDKRKTVPKIPEELLKDIDQELLKALEVAGEKLLSQMGKKTSRREKKRRKKAIREATKSVNQILPLATRSGLSLKPCPPIEVRQSQRPRTFVDKSTMTDDENSSIPISNVPMLPPKTRNDALDKAAVLAHFGVQYHYYEPDTAREMLGIPIRNKKRKKNSEAEINPCSSMCACGEFHETLEELYEEPPDGESCFDPPKKINSRIEVGKDLDEKGGLTEKNDGKECPNSMSDNSILWPMDVPETPPPAPSKIKAPKKHMRLVDEHLTMNKLVDAGSDTTEIIDEPKSEVDRVEENERLQHFLLQVDEIIDKTICLEKARKKKHAFEMKQRLLASERSTICSEDWRINEGLVEKPLPKMSQESWQKLRRRLLLPLREEIRDLSELEKLKLEYFRFPPWQNVAELSAFEVQQIDRINMTVDHGPPLLSRDKEVIGWNQELMLKGLSNRPEVSDRTRKTLIFMARIGDYMRYNGSQFVKMCTLLMKIKTNILPEYYMDFKYSFLTVQTYLKYFIGTPGKFLDDDIADLYCKVLLFTRVNSQYNIFIEQKRAQRGTRKDKEQCKCCL